METVTTEKMISAALDDGWKKWKAHGSQKTLAAATGIGRSTISQILSRDLAGTWEALTKLALAFGHADLSDFLAHGKSLAGGGASPAFRPANRQQAPGNDQIKLPAWDRRELSKLEREHLEMALVVLRSKQVDGGGYALALRQNIKQFYKPVAAEIAAQESDSNGSVRRGPAGKKPAKSRAVGGAS